MDYDHLTLELREKLSATKPYDPQEPAVETSAIPMYSSIDWNPITSPTSDIIATNENVSYNVDISEETLEYDSVQPSTNYSTLDRTTKTTTLEKAVAGKQDDLSYCYPHSTHLNDRRTKGGIGCVKCLLIILFVSILSTAASVPGVLAYLEVWRLNLQQSTLTNASESNQLATGVDMNITPNATQQDIDTNASINSSCASILETYPSSPSGYYWIRSIKNDVVWVYCDMTRSCGNITGGWMRVAELDTRRNGSQCPSGLIKAMYSNGSTCVQNFMDAGCSLDSDYSAHGISYATICGRILARQVGTHAGFRNVSFVESTGPVITPDTNYVDGVSLTHGMNHGQHIWTFAAGACPCFSGKPSFVGDNLSCDDSAAGELWDGNGCDEFNPLWFYRQLPQPTTDDIQMRVCRNQPRHVGDIGIDQIEMNVH